MVLSGSEQEIEIVRAWHNLKRAEMNLIRRRWELPRGEFMMLHQINLCNNEQKTACAGEPGVRASHIGEVMEISRPAVSQMLKALERKGLIERTTAPNDRRMVSVRLTRQGRELLDRAWSDYTDMIRRVCVEMGQDGTQQLIESFNRLYQVSEKIKKDMD